MKGGVPVQVFRDGLKEANGGSKEAASPTIPSRRLTGELLGDHRHCIHSPKSYEL